MSITTTPNHITWNLYLRSGPVEIWEGHPRFGSWTQYEVRNTKTGETRAVEEANAAFVFNQMITNSEND